MAFAGLYLISALPLLVPPGPPVAAIVLSVLLAAALVALSVIDLRTMRLPDVLTLPLAAIGILVATELGWAPLWWRLVSAGVGFLALYAVAVAYRRLRGASGLGLGDAKLFAAAGGWVGLEGLPTVMLYAAGMALIGALVAGALGGKVSARTRFAFGPFLAFGLWLVWLYGPLT